jgi:hypothetical protein
MHQLVIFGEIRVGRRPLSQADLERELCRNVLAYLGVPDPRSEA